MAEFPYSEVRQSNKVYDLTDCEYYYLKKENASLKCEIRALKKKEKDMKNRTDELLLEKKERRRKTLELLFTFKKVMKRNRDLSNSIIERRKFDLPLLESTLQRFTRRKSYGNLLELGDEQKSNWSKSILKVKKKNEEKTEKRKTKLIDAKKKIIKMKSRIREIRKEFEEMQKEMRRQIDFMKFNILYQSSRPDVSYWHSKRELEQEVVDLRNKIKEMQVKFACKQMELIQSFGMIKNGKVPLTKDIHVMKRRRKTILKKIYI